METRRKLVAGNWKMNLTPTKATEFMGEFIPEIPEELSYDIALFPAFPVIPYVLDYCIDIDLFIGGQNCSEHVSGAYTGEVAAEMLADAGCSMVLLGHSERRQYFGEDEALLARKLKAAFANNLIPVYCLGETLPQRESGDTFKVLDRQLTALAELSDEERQQTVIAYEPVWAIGTGVTASPEQAQEAHAYLRKQLTAMWGNVAHSTRILYGGSVTPANAATLFACPDVDGGLVGGASLKVESFLQICRAAAS